jgi:hypothetical protein
LMLEGLTVARAEPTRWVDDGGRRTARPSAAWHGDRKVRPELRSSVGRAATHGQRSNVMGSRGVALAQQGTSGREWMTALLSSGEAEARWTQPIAPGPVDSAGSPAHVPQRHASVRWVVGSMFGLSLLASLLLFFFKPIVSGHQYQLGVRVTGLLALIWYVGTFKAHWLGQRWFLGLVFVAGLYVAIERPLTIRAGSEIVAAYGSAFAELDAGRNPYTSGAVVHFDEQGRHELGNFNYPPVELVSYYGVSKLIGRWDHRVLTGTLLVLQVAACGLLYLTFPSAGAGAILAFAPLLVCFELHTNVALTLVGVAVAMYLLCRPARAAPARGHAVLMAWFGVALLTKFLVIPLFAAYVVRRLSFRSWRAFAASAAGPGLALGVATLLMVPFGVANVLRETLLFNLVLSERAKLTTFYPNVLSGTLSWLGVPGAFPVFAVLLLGAAVLWSRRLPLLAAMFFAACVFLLVSPTPEPQYVPVMLYVALCAQLQAIAGRAAERARAALSAARGEPPPR